MADIVTMLVSAIVSALESDTDIATVGRAPMAEYQDDMEGASIGIVYINDPDDMQWQHELELKGPHSARLVGEGATTHRPWTRRFCVRLKYIFTDNTRADAVSEFSKLMCQVETVFATWSTMVGPDDYGETMNRACETVVQSFSDYIGGESEFVVSGKVRVEFHTT